MKFDQKENFLTTSKFVCIIINSKKVWLQQRPPAYNDSLVLGGTQCNAKSLCLYAGYDEFYSRVVTLSHKRNSL